MEQQAQSKPTREELLQKLRNRKLQGTLLRMKKKVRENKLENFKQKAQEHQNALMENIKNLSPEQLKEMGIDINLLNNMTVANE